MSNKLLNDCLVTFIERDIFSNVNEDAIIYTFMNMRKRKAYFHEYKEAQSKSFRLDSNCNILFMKDFLSLLEFFMLKSC